MRSLDRAGSHRRLATLGLFMISSASLVSGLAFNLCSSINTAGTERNVSTFQSNGLCADFCRADYAFAITQDNSCWCSNIAPAKPVQLDGGDCSTTCPAYPYEFCGGPNAFAYISLGGHLPSGTEGAPEPSSTAQPSSSKPPPPPPPPSTTSKTSSETTSTSTESSSTTTDPPTSVVQTVTADGSVKTVTVEPTPIAVPSGGATSSGDNAGHTVKSDGLDTGAVVGIVVGVIGGVLALAGLLVFWYLRRKKRAQQDAYQDDPSIRGSPSDMMGSSQRPDMSMAGAPPASPTSAGNRSSVLAIDPRMDPFKQGLYIRSGSHESINSLSDEHDYSRRIQGPKVLRATNPDVDN